MFVPRNHVEISIRRRPIAPYDLVEGNLRRADRATENDGLKSSFVILRRITHEIIANHTRIHAHKYTSSIAINESVVTRIHANHC